MEDNLSARACLVRDWDNVGLNITESGSHCPSTWDGLLCWDSTPAGNMALSKCPSFKGSDVTKSAFRVCSLSGQWLDRYGNPSATGWTNYSSCLTPEIREIMKKLGSNDDAQTKYDIAVNTRILEFVGLSLSLAALLLSLVILCYFRTLRNSRTRLHRHLFVAMVIQVGIRLVVYTDQALTRSFDMEANRNANVSSNSNSSVSSASSGESGLNQHRRGIDNTPILCEASYISLEYARTAMFMWMFVEGLYLHNMITVTVFGEKFSPLVYPVIGWLVPVPLTFVWAVVTHLHYGTAICWWGYNLTLYFWILEGPRLAVLVVNIAFLLNILRVLITKLRQSNSSETQQAMKAVKAALVLLPLLGLTNLLNMLDAPLEKSPFQFALWSYSTHLLTSSQGFILAFLYCFRNGEVQTTLRKFVRNRIFGYSKCTKFTKRRIQLYATDNGSMCQNECNQSQDLSLSLKSNPMVVLTLESVKENIAKTNRSPFTNGKNNFCQKPINVIADSSGNLMPLTYGFTKHFTNEMSPLVENSNRVNRKSSLEAQVKFVNNLEEKSQWPRWEKVGNAQRNTSYLMSIRATAQLNDERKAKRSIDYSSSEGITHSHKLFASLQQLPDCTSGVV